MDNLKQQLNEAFYRKFGADPEYDVFRKYLVKEVIKEKIATLEELDKIDMGDYYETPLEQFDEALTKLKETEA